MNVIIIKSSLIYFFKITTIFCFFKKNFVYNLISTYIKLLINILLDNNIILKLLVLMILIILMILLQLFLINILYKEKSLNYNKINLNWGNKLKNLFFYNFWFIIICTSLYTILHSNFFLLHFSILFFLCFFFTITKVFTTIKTYLP